VFLKNDSLSTTPSGLDWHPLMLRPCRSGEAKHENCACCCYASYGVLLVL
jgi:hypothetical protein